MTARYSCQRYCRQHLAMYRSGCFVRKVTMPVSKQLGGQHFFNYMSKCITLILWSVVFQLGFLMGTLTPEVSFCLWLHYSVGHYFVCVMVCDVIILLLAATSGHHLLWPKLKVNARNT